MSVRHISIPLPEGFTVVDFGWILDTARATLGDLDWDDGVTPDDIWSPREVVLHADYSFSYGDARRFREALRRHEWDVEPDYETALAWIDGTAIPFPKGFTIRDLAWLEDKVADVLRDCDCIPHPDNDADIVWYSDCLRIYLEIDAERALELREALRAHEWDVRPDFEPVFAWADGEVDL